MFPNVGFPELILILLIALLVFGPQRMVGMGTALGRAIREFRHSLEGTDEKPGEDEPHEPPSGAGA